MSVSRKLLIIGLLNAPKRDQASLQSLTPEGMKASVQAEFRKIKEAGYDMDVSLCDDKHFDDALAVG